MAEQLRAPVAVGRQHGGLYRSGVDGVHPDSPWSQFDGGHLRQPPNRPFGASIGRVVGDPLHASNGRDVDDPPAAGLGHGVGHALDAQERAQVIHLPDAAQALGGLIGYGGSPVDGSVVHQRPQRPLLHRDGHNPSPILGRRHVVVEIHGPVAQLSSHCLPRLVEHVAHHHECAFLHELPGLGLALPPSRPGHNRYPSIKTSHGEVLAQRLLLPHR